MFKSVCCGFFVLFFLSACAGSGGTVLLYSDNEMEDMGGEAFKQIKEEEKIAKDKVAKAYISCVANPIIRYLPEFSDPAEWEIVLFESSQVNAFALPGRKIGIYTALLELADGPHKLATIIGHELAHITLEHGNQRMSQRKLASSGMALLSGALDLFDASESQQSVISTGLTVGLQLGILLPYSRQHEQEADIMGLRYMAQAGFDPRASIPLWQEMSSGKNGFEFLSTHPSGENRINKLASHMDEMLPLYEATAPLMRPACTPPVTTE